jgi:redox-sensing transcriptional repressor
MKYYTTAGIFPSAACGEVRLEQITTDRTGSKPLSLTQPRTVTSSQIAEALDLDATQVRKDFRAIGLIGTGRVGFDVCEVCRAIRNALGFNETHPAVLVGTGHLGSSILAYNGFARYGLHIVAAFDSDSHKVGTEVVGYTVKSVRTLKPFVRKHGIKLAVVTASIEGAQQVADRLVSAGVRAIWNFAPTKLNVPADIMVRDEHLSLGLAEITHCLAHQPAGAGLEPPLSRPA